MTILSRLRALEAFMRVANPALKRGLSYQQEQAFRGQREFQAFVAGQLGALADRMDVFDSELRSLRLKIEAGGAVLRKVRKVKSRKSAKK